MQRMNLREVMEMVIMAEIKDQRVSNIQSVMSVAECSAFK